MEKQLNSFLAHHSKIPPVYIPFSSASNQFVFCNMKQNSVTSIIVDSYETGRLTGTILNYLLIWIYEYERKEPNCSSCNNSWLGSSEQFSWKHPLNMADQTDLEEEEEGEGKTPC